MDKNSEAFQLENHYLSRVLDEVNRQYDEAMALKERFNEIDLETRKELGLCGLRLYRKRTGSNHRVQK